LESSSAVETTKELKVYLIQFKVKRDKKYLKDRAVLSAKVKDANLNPEQKAFRT
jgi:hypothetical protein